MIDPDAQLWAKRRDVPVAILGWLTVVGIGFWLLGHISHTLVLVIIAAFFAYALSPAVKMLERHIPRLAAILGIYLVVLSSLGVLLYISISTAVFQFTQLAHSINVFITSPDQFNRSPFVATLMNFGFSEEQLSQVGSQLVVRAEQLTTSLIPFLSSVFTLILDVVLVAVLSIYLLVDGARLLRLFRETLPPVHRRRVMYAIKTVEQIVGGYIRGQTILALIISVLIGVGMMLFQVPYAVLLGVLSFILEYIPILGSFIAGIICVLLALTKGWAVAVFVLGYFVIIHVMEGDILGPRIVGKALGLHPLVSLVALLVGTELFGITGALLASPVAGIIQVAVISLWDYWQDTQSES